MMHTIRSLVLRLRGGSDHFEPAVCADFTSHESQRGKRPLKANGQAWHLAVALLRGGQLTVQDYVRLLERHGMVSNHPLTRMREAIKWLEHHHVVVSVKLEGDGQKRKRWYVSTLSQAENCVKAKKLLGIAS